MRTKRTYAYAHSRTFGIGVHDFASLIKHLHLFLGIAVVCEDIYLRNDIICQLMREFLHRFHLTVFHHLLILLLQFCHRSCTGTTGTLMEAMWIRLIWDSFSSGCNTTTIIIVVQVGLAMMPRGRLRASSGLHSGTTNGTSSHMRKALELSIITAPCLVMVSAKSLDVPPPAETNATSISLKSSLCCKV